VGRAMKEAIAHARSGKGAYFLEFKTYRLAPHHTADQCLYRDKKEHEEAVTKDPLPRAAKVLLDRKWATEAELKRLTEKGLTLIDEAVQALEQSGMPDPATVMNHVVAG
jgi:TPP-dependent pyruvate/acetoin dehydrogenase alpha subunit